MAIDTSRWDDVQLDPVSPPPEDFDGLSVEEAVELIKDWFFRNFEDPAQSTPYDGGEGGYQYIWGGPYEAGDVISDVFADVTSDEIINIAIEAIEREGLEWVPHEGRVQPPEDWVERNIPDHPHTIFMDSYFQSMSIIADHGSDDGSYW
jgi:hypothetical protein